VLTLNETHIFSPNLVNEARLGFNRISIAFNPSNLTDPTSVGISDGLKGPVGLPQILISDISLTFGGPSGFPQGRNDTLGVLSDTATLLRGSHSIKFGGEFRRYLVANFGLSIGAITFPSTTLNFMQDTATVFSSTPTMLTPWERL
jgi:hypothetical protein